MWKDVVDDVVNVHDIKKITKVSVNIWNRTFVFLLRRMQPSNGLAFPELFPPFF